MTSPNSQPGNRSATLRSLCTPLALALATRLPWRVNQPVSLARGDNFDGSVIPPVVRRGGIVNSH